MNKYNTLIPGKMTHSMNRRDEEQTGNLMVRSKHTWCIMLFHPVGPHVRRIDKLEVCFSPSLLYDDY